jgi:hypothetical protein
MTTHTNDAAGLERIGESVERWGKRADALKSLGWMVAAIVGAAFYGYHHFASEEEIVDLQCSIQRQDDMNMALQQANTQVRTALHTLELELADPSQQEQLRKDLAAAIKSIDGSLAHVEEVRNGMAHGSIRKQKGTPC